MSYLRFEKAVMTNLEESLRRELLRTNRGGAYSASTLVDCNTRKYHGLLVVPVPQIDDENHVLLSSLDCTVVQHGAEFNLGLHKYQGNNFSPKGHKYIREFDASLIPTTVYRVGGVILKRETIFQAYEDRILIRYTLEEAHSATLLRFRPFLAFRSVRQFTHENSVASREYQLVDNGISTCMYRGYPDLFMQFNKKNEFIFQPDWYRGIEYPKEQERGYASNEDLYVPGYFELPIKKGESIVFAASTSQIKSSTLKGLFQKELDICFGKFRHEPFIQDEYLESCILVQYLVLSAGKQRLLSVLSQQIRETDISGLVLSAACLFRHCAAEEGLSGAGVSLKYDAATVIDKPAASQIGDNASAERAFIDVQDVMDIRLRETELRVLDQPAHLLIVFPLIDTVCQKLEAVIKRKSKRLWILLLYFEFFYEFADTQNAVRIPAVLYK